MKHLIIAIAILACSVTSALATSITEEFENETANTTTFSESGFTFTSTGDLIVEFFMELGSEESDFWLGTDFQDNQGTVGVAGSILIDNANSYFEITSFDGWTSANNGQNFQVGTVTFTGTEYLTGNLISAVVTITPTGDLGDVYDKNLNFSGTALAGIMLTSLEVDLTGSGLDYVALDNLDIDVATATNGDIPEPTTMALLATGAAGLIAKRRRVV